MRGFDVIGDVHGEADKLSALLRALGYQHRGGCWRHRVRQAIFVGDLIDRGAQQLEVIELVQSMVESGAAQIVLGNHEFNAIALTAFNVDTSDFRRTRRGRSGQRHLDAHSAFLDAVGLDSRLHRDVIAWFRTFPFHLELDDLRVVHACWHRKSLDLLAAAHRVDGSLSDEFIAAATTRGTPEFRAVEIALKGPEVHLAGQEYLDKGSHRRDSARLRWWHAGAASYRDLAMVPGHATAVDGSAIEPISNAAVPRDQVISYTDPRPVIFGHYWMTGAPELTSSYTACVDFSAAAGGPMVAYRWDGERELDSTKFIAAG